MEMRYAWPVEREMEDTENAGDLPMPDDGCEIRPPSDDGLPEFMLAGEREREELRELQEHRQFRARSLGLG